MLIFLDMPEFGDITAVKRGKNPIFVKRGQSVPNDVYLSSGHHFNIITGVNMVPEYSILYLFYTMKSGKTTYIKTVALLQIMVRKM
jgi:DNA mismatch repair ATPase MutS